MRVIVLFSTKCGNTQKVADEIASELNCESIRITKNKPEKVVELINYDLVVVGSGIRFGEPYDDIVNYLKTINLTTTKKFALFVTWGGAAIANQVVFSILEKILESKNQTVFEDFFSCYGKWKILRRGHPNTEDLKAARIWAQNLISKFSCARVSILGVLC